MTAPIRQLDRASIEGEVFAITRGLLEELGSHPAGAIRGKAHLDRDLGLGSLERVELQLRIDRSFGTSLPEEVATSVETLDDIVTALLENPATAPTHPPQTQSATARTVVQGDGAAAPEDAETWQEVLRYRAERDAGRVHLILWEQDGEAQQVTFGELYSGAQAVAASLERRGIVPGDTVALMLPTSREFFPAFAGVLLAGGVPAPIYPPVRADRIAEYAGRQSAILRNAEAKLLVTFREAAAVAKLLRPQVPSLRGIVTAAELAAPESAPDKKSGPAGEPVAARGTDLALLQYTSGSTGDPKGVMLTHGNLLANVRAIGEALAVRPTDVGVSWLPLYHDMGLIGAWLMPLYFGLPVVVLSPVAFLTRPERWLRAIDRYRGTITAAPNFAYELAVRKVTKEDSAGLDLSSMRAMLNGAEPVNAKTLERFAERFAANGLRREALLPVYGLAESSLAVTVPPLERTARVDRVVRSVFEEEGRAVPAAAGAEEGDVLTFVSVGRPLAGHEVRIVADKEGVDGEVDPEGREVGEKTEGALWFRGPSTTGGYFRNEDASQKLFPAGKGAGWLQSGDRAYQSGGEFFITGRNKEIILKAGRNLYPHEIEEIAGRVPGVRKGCVAAFGAADAAAGTERLVVAAETRERGTEARRRISAAITEQMTEAIGLPPDAVELLAPHSIPKTSSGKLRRDHARKLYLAGTLGKSAPPAWLQIAKLAGANAARTAGRRLRRGCETLYGIYAAGIFIPWLAMSWFIVRWMPSRRAAARFTSAALKVYLVLVFCRVRVNGREHLICQTTGAGPGPRVLVSNHASYLDVLVLMAALGVEYHFVAKHEVYNMPFIGVFMRKLEHFDFDRGSRTERLRQAEQLEEALRKGESVFVFPEGTFTAQDGVRPFHLGAFKAAANTGCPIVPVGLRGTRRFLRDGTYLPRPTSVTLTVCPPITPPAGGRASWREVLQLRDQTRAQIAALTGEPLL